MLYISSKVVKAPAIAMFHESAEQTFDIRMLIISPIVEIRLD